MSPEVRPTPRGESLERFLAKLPDRWRQDEEAALRPTKVRAPHNWRTRKDPFEGVWCDVLGWLQSTYPDRFDRAHLRTLQRRVQQWRGIMASKLVYPVSSETTWDEHLLRELALVESGPKR